MGVAEREKNTMTRYLRVLLIFTTASFLAGCTSSMVTVVDVDGLHIIHRSLTKARVKEAIIEGAETAGWLTKDMGDGRILATYHVRNHTVHVRIDYINSNYRTGYSSSNGMKMFCSERDKKTHQLKVSGRDKCRTGGPAYIHGNYKKWVDSLNTSIQNSLSSI